jgi:hypothetical protein
MKQDEFNFAKDPEDKTTASYDKHCRRSVNNFFFREQDFVVMTSREVPDIHECNSDWTA